MGSNSSYSDSDHEEASPIELESHDIEGIAKYMKSERCKKVFVMVGAGLSVAAGIPDFRSPETGLYANLDKFDLPYPEAIFELGYFREHPEAFYAFARDFDPSVFRPTLSHSFLHLLHTKGALHTCFTQNIDGLERRAYVPQNKLVEAHGTIATARCVNCKSAYDTDKLWDAIRAGVLARCAQCEAVVKPDIVFFGESLPADFSTRALHLQDADLLLILGTSLTVWPFAGLTRFVPQSCPRVLFNLEPAGDIGTRANDVELLGKCDDVVRELCRHLGWEQELDKEWALTTVGRVLSEEEAKDRQAREAQEGEAHAKVAANKRANKGVPRLSDVQIDQLTAVIAKKLDLGDKKDGEETNEEDKEDIGIQESPSSKTDNAAHPVEGKPTTTSTETADTSEKPVKL